MSLHVAECNGPTYMPSRQKAPDSPQRQEWVTQIDVAIEGQEAELLGRRLPGYKEGNLTDNRDLITHPMHGRVAVSDCHVHIDSCEHIADVLSMNIRSAEKGIWAPGIDGEAKIDTSRFLESGADRRIRNDLVNHNRRGHISVGRSWHLNTISVDSKLQWSTDVGEDNKNLAAPVVRIVPLEIKDTYPRELNEPHLIGDIGRPTLVNRESRRSDQPILTSERRKAYSRHYNPPRT